MKHQPLIEELALLSDRNTCAVLDRNGTILWYCPERFDAESIFSAIVDPDNGGYWSLEIGEGKLISRSYIDRSSVLEHRFCLNDRKSVVRDWMPIGTDFNGIVREFSPVAGDLTATLRVRSHYGAKGGGGHLIDEHTVLFDTCGLYLIASHPLNVVDQDTVRFHLQEGESGWAILTSTHIEPKSLDLPVLLENTLRKWEDIASLFNYDGLYEQEVMNSIRAIQQLTCGTTGGVLAAATTSLPEVIGGERNYDYRYVWVRDAALITGALSALDVKGRVEVDFLEFMYRAMKKNTGQCVYPLYTIDQNVIDHLDELDVAGYKASRPVLIGNVASEQRQLDAEANILISSKIIYDKYQEKFNWPMVRKVAEYVCKNWHKPENGIWEEGAELHYTSGKIFAAIGLEMIAKFSDNQSEVDRWLQQAKLIRAFVREKCLTPEGAYANYAGSDQVDVSAALYVLWNYAKPDSPEMLATVKALERDYAKENLYWRTLVEFDSSKEGAFLAGSCWMAHYYAVAGNFEKSEKILDAVKAYQNDLGFFSEEADIENEKMLGNFDQTFVHSSFICAANGLSREKEGIDTVVR